MSRLINPYQTFRDTAGEVVSNGTLEFYETGTSTPKDYYSDAELTVSVSTPYDLDAYGRVTGNVWLDGDYRIIVKDSDGATVYTIDDVSSISTTGGGGGTSTETVQGTVYNKFINGACRVPSEGGSVSISGSYQESEVAEISVKAQGTPTNGTADLVKNATVGTSGYALRITDLTTGDGGTVDYRFRFDSVDSRDMVNGAAVFQCNVLQNTGASKTYTISILKANAEDDFSGTTLISASSGDSVSDSTNTRIFHPVSDMGDCSNGIEVVVSVACGAVTTKDFYINDIVFRRGQSAITFAQFPYDRDYAAIKFAQQDFYGPPGYLYGLGISNGTDADHDIDIAVGGCRNSDNTKSIELTTGITKQIDAVWAEGTNAGGFPSAGGSGLTLANNTCYGVFLIRKADGTVNAGFDSNADASVLLNADNAGGSNYVYYRRIGWVRTDGAQNIIEFRQYGDEFVWSAPFEAAAYTDSATSTNVVVGAPPDTIWHGIFHFTISAGSTRHFLARPVGSTDVAPSATNFTGRMEGVGTVGEEDSINVDMITDSSSQIAVRVDDATNISCEAVMSLGWTDSRGRL